MRSTWKKFIAKVQGKDNTLLRHASIGKELLDKRINVYNGKRYQKIFVQLDMIGYKAGDFVFTRKRCIHKKIKKTTK